MITKYLKLSLLAFTVGCGFVATSLTSCQMKEDDLFDVDPANRADAWMADYRRVFNNNEHGWALYTDNPTSGRHPAVYTFAVKFDQYYSTFYQSSTTQRLANPDDRAADSIRSMYSFKMDNGIVLSFDTYNGFFHINADQSQYFSGDLQGDFEFCLERYSENEDTIFGHGKTKLLPFVMIKMPCKAPEYQVRTDSIQNYFSPYNCSFVCAGDTLVARFLSGYQNLSIWMEGDDPSIDGHLYSYGNLIGGIYFLEPIEYKGHIIKEMHLNADKSGYEDINGQASIIPKPLSHYFTRDQEYDSRFWGYSCCGPDTKAEWDKARAALDGSRYKSNSLVYLCLSSDGRGGIELVANMWYGSGEIHFPLEMKEVDNDHIALKWTGKETSGLGYTIYDLGFKYILDAIAPKNEFKTFRVSSQGGSKMTPSELTLIDESNPNNWFFFGTNWRYYHSSIWD